MKNILLTLLLFLIVNSNSFCQNKLIVSKTDYDEDNKYIDSSMVEMAEKLIEDSHKQILDKDYSNYKIIDSSEVRDYKNFTPRSFSIKKPNLSLPKSYDIVMPELHISKHYEDEVNPISKDYPFTVLTYKIIHLSKPFELVVEYSLYDGDENYDMGNVKIIKNTKDEYSREFEYKMMSVARYLNDYDIIYTKEKNKVLIKHQKNSVVGSRFKVFEGKKYITFLTIITLAGEYDIAMVEKKNRQVKPLYVIKPAHNIMVDITLSENIYVGIIGTSDIFFGTAFNLIPYPTLRNLKPIMGVEILYNYSNYNLMYNTYIGMIYEFKLGAGFRLAISTTAGMIISNKIISHISSNSYLILEYMVASFMSVQLGSGFVYYFFVKEDYHYNYTNIGAIPISVGVSFKL